MYRLAALCATAVLCLAAMAALVPAQSTAQSTAQFTAQSTAQSTTQAPAPAAVAFELVGSIGGSTHGLEVVGDRAYARIGRRLAVFDVSQPAQPRVLGSALTNRYGAVYGPGTAEGLELVGRHAYLPGEFGIEVFDLASDTTPTRVGLVPSAGVVPPGGSSPQYWIDVRANAEGDLLFALSSRSVDVTDISDGAMPQIVSRIAAANPLVDMAVAGDLLVTAGGGLTVYDVSDATNPQVLASATFVDPRGMTVVDSSGLAVMGIREAGQELRLHFFSLENGTIQDRSTIDLGSHGWRWTLASHAEQLWLSNSTFLYAVDVADLAAPELTVSLAGAYYLLEPSGSLLWTTGPSHTIAAYTAATTATAGPDLVGSYNEPDRVTAVQVDGDRVVALNRFAPGDDHVLVDVAVVQAADPRAMRFTDRRALAIPRVTDASFEGMTTGPFLAAGGGLASVVWGWHLHSPSHLELINTLLPGLPTVGSAEVRTPYGVWMGAGSAFVATQGGGVQIVRTSGPGAPAVVGLAGGSGTANSVAVRGTTLFTATEWRGLGVYDIADPSQPVAVATAELGSPHGLTLDSTGGWLFAPGWYRSTPTTTPSSPPRRMESSGEGRAEGPAADALKPEAEPHYTSTVQPRDSVRGLVVYDVRDRAAPRREAYWEGLTTNRGGTMRGTVIGDVLLVAGEAFDVSTPSAPKPVSTAAPVADRSAPMWIWRGEHGAVRGDTAFFAADGVVAVRAIRVTTRTPTSPRAWVAFLPTAWQNGR